MQEHAISMPSEEVSETFEAVLRHARIEFTVEQRPFGTPVFLIAKSDYVRVQDIIREWSQHMQWIAHAI